ELLNPALLEVSVLRKDGAFEIRRSGSRGEGNKARGHIASGFKRFPVEWWILPQSLRALIPGRVMEDGITRANNGVVASERFPGAADTRFERRPIHVDSGIRARVHSGNKEFGGSRIEIRLAIAHLGLGCHHGPGQAEIQSQILADAPV